MKKVISLCSFGLLGTFAMASNEIVKSNEESQSSEVETATTIAVPVCTGWSSYQMEVFDCDPNCEEPGTYVTVTVRICNSWAI